VIEAQPGSEAAKTVSTSPEMTVRERSSVT
jgi:hypothetical protein